MPNYMSPTLFSMAFADETSYATRATTGWTWFLSTFPTINFAREIQELDLGVNSDFAIAPRVVGSRHGGTVSFSVPLRSQASTYDPSSAGPTANPEMDLLSEIIGASLTGTYVAADVTGTDANTWSCVTDISGDTGECYIAAAAATGDITAAGWVTGVSGAGPYTVELFEDGRAIPGAGENLIPTVTMYPSGGDPVSKTFRLVGQDADHDVQLIGCIPESVTISLNAGQVPQAEFTYRFDDFYYDSTGGGLQTADDFVRLAPIMGVHDGRIWLDGVGDSDGTAETTGTCGLGSVSVAISLELADIPCHAGNQGVATIAVLRRNATVSATIPWHADFIEAGNLSAWDDSLENGTPISFSLLAGGTIGQFLSVLVPAGVVIDQAQLGTNDNVVGWSVTFAPSSYSGDTATGGGAGDTSFRLAFG